MVKKKQDLRAVDKPLYSYWQAIGLSFYAYRVYVDVVKRWRGVGLIYLLLIAALAAMPLSLRVMWKFNSYVNEQLIFPIKVMPELIVQNGEISINKPMPYQIINSKGDVLAVVDTKTDIEYMLQIYPHAVVIITKDKIYYRPPTPQFFIGLTDNNVGEPIEQSLDKDSNEIFNGQEWFKSSNILRVKWIGIAVFYPMMTTFIYTLYISFMFILALMGQLIAQMLFSLKMTYKETCRLLSVAATPVSVFMSLILTAGLSFPYLGITYLIILAAYFSFAVIAIKRALQQLVHS